MLRKDFLMNEVKIYQKRSKLTIRLILALYTTIMFIVLTYVGMFLLNIPIVTAGIVGIIISFGYTVSVVSYLYKPRAVITIDKEGIIDNSTWPRIGRIAWEDIDSFYKAKVLKKTSIYVKLKDNQKLLSSFPKWKELFIKWNTPRGIDPVAISVNITDRRIDEVIEILDAHLKLAKRK